MAEVSRRTFLKGVVAAAAVVGYDPLRRSWVTAAQAAETGADLAAMPSLDGQLLTDPASLSAAADDFGHIIHRQPRAVLKPGSIEDIARVIRFARRYGIKVGARGQGHSTYGQPQVEAGVVIDMGTLNRIHAITPNFAEVDAGVVWSALLQQCLPLGYTPPVMTDYIELSVGGTLSVGGIGGASHQYGVQADNVEELWVVTGEGNLERCSEQHKSKLFNAALAGLGQVGIIVRARVKLIPAKTHARVFLLYYNDLATFTEDQQTLIGDERFNYVEGQVLPDGNGGWFYMLEAASFYTPPSAPNNAALLRGLRHNQGTEDIQDKSYFDFLNRLAPTIEFLKSIGVWDFPHPWFDVFVPSQSINNYVGGILSTLTLDDTGQGPILIYPVKAEKFKRPFFRVPNGRTSFLFDILRTAPPVQAVVDAMVASNRTLFERNRGLGGNRYAIGAIPFTPEDWRQHFGPAWDDLRKAKRQYDPDNVLTPGQGIFL